jgi:hypothetical protein
MKDSANFFEGGVCKTDSKKRFFLEVPTKNTLKTAFWSKDKERFFANKNNVKILGSIFSTLNCYNYVKQIVLMGM